MKKVKLMPDYFCYPLWEASPGEFGNIDPSSLPISTALQEKLLDWSRTFDQTLDMDDPSSAGFKSEDTVIAFNRMGAELANQLREELGSEYAIIEKFVRKRRETGD